ncbi:MAG TPA: LCCL domain-containing protein [Myxococcota bacterium]|nr:LCCL domain-containing protein [Myxococcota bacterium]
MKMTGRAIAALVLVLGSASATGGELPRDAAKLISKFELAAEKIRGRAEDEIKPLRIEVIRILKSLQDKYTRAAMLDEAVAVRDEIRALRGVRPDPGYLRTAAGDIGKRFLYEVTGSLQGSVWGSEVYTSDSHLGAAAVHAGLLKPGEHGVVLVRILPGQKSYQGSTANGVTSNAYGPWSVSFTIEKYRDDSF